MTLFKEFRQIVEPVLLTVVKDTEKPCDANNVPEVLKRDACKLIMSLFCQVLFGTPE